MWVHIINIYPNELLFTKSKSLELMNINFFLNEQFTFLPSNILIRIFKELKKIYKNDNQ